MKHLFIASGALFSLSGVILRSLSSHAIKELLTQRDKLGNFNLAADYLVLHGLALIVLAVLVHIFPRSNYQRAGFFFIAGSLLFQYSVIIKSFIPIQPFGFITPLGGFLLMTGWGLIVFSAYKGFLKEK